jgi:CheY-like chemotaxis protein
VVVKPVRQTRLAETLARALGLSAPAAVRAPALPAPAPSSPALRHRILLVEDNPDNQKLAQRVLEAAGAIVETAENGEIAVEMAKSVLYDLVVMDLMMPVMDGFQATQRIRENEVPPNRVPIVALTAHATEGFRDRCLAAGMDDYLSKPFKKERFLALVEQWVDRRPIVLVADDAPENRLIVKRFLMLGGDYRLLFATNGKEAVELFARRPVSLVLLDVEMPVLDGLGAASELRRAPEGGQVPILAMTAHTSVESVRACLEAGCTAVLQKPLERRTLNTIVAKLLQQRPADGEPALEPTEPAGDSDVVRVDPDIVDLVPRFLENQRSHPALILELTAGGDFESARRLAHNMKGTGKGYGFDVISSFGASIEQAASRSDATEIHRLARQLESYLAGVRWEPRVKNG